MFTRMVTIQIAVYFIFGCGNTKPEASMIASANSQSVTDKQHVFFPPSDKNMKTANYRLHEDLCEKVECRSIDCKFEFSPVDNVAFCPDWIREDNPIDTNHIDLISEGCVAVESESAFDKTLFLYPTTCPSLKELPNLCGSGKISGACCKPVFERGIFMRYGKERDGDCFVLDSWGNNLNETMVKQFREPSLETSVVSNVESYRLIGSSFGASFSIRIEKNIHGVFLIRKLSPYVFRKEGEESITYTVVSDSQWNSFKNLVKIVSPKNLDKIKARKVKDGQTVIFEFLDKEGHIALLRSNYMEPELAHVENYFYYLAGVLPDTKRCAEETLPGEGT